ncbi:MAG: hypothetical protein HYX67_05335 [Candidatus Melainabacteria bacterium]|nr:hypothetical protein [Candidatus Melainabacteria bacterium]
MMNRVLTRQPLKLSSTLLALVVVTLAPSGAWASPASDEADIANSLAKQGCYDTAVMFYEKALRLNPGFGPAIAGRAAALKRLKSGGKGKKGRNEDFVATPTAAPNKAAEKAAKAAELAAAKAAETAARNAESAARAKSQEEAAAKRAAQVAANAAKAAQAQAAAAAAASAKAKTAVATPNSKTKPGAAAKAKPAVAAVKPKPVVVVEPAKPKPVAVVEPAKPKPVAVEKPKQVVAAAKPKPAVETKPAVVAAVAPPAKPVVTAKPKPVAEEIPQTKPIAVASIHAAPNPDSSVLGTSRPAAIKSALQSAPVEHTIPSDVGSAPPMSSLSEDGSHPSIGDTVPTWLYGMAAGTFLLLIVLAIWWLSPTLTASRQLQNRLKGLERTRDER